MGKFVIANHKMNMTSSDIKKYLSKDEFVDSAGQGHNKPDGVTLSWDKGSMDYTTATITYYTKADMSDALSIATSGNSVKINNLLSNTKYIYISVRSTVVLVNK